MSTLAKIGAKAGEYAVLAAALFFVLPLYIDGEVERRLSEIGDGDTPLAEEAPIVELSTKVDSLGEGQARIERKVDAFANTLIEYLQREAQ